MNFFLFPFFRQNLLGVIIGIGLCSSGFALFFFTLGYGASCPEAGPQRCSFDLKPFFPILAVNIAFFMSIWMVLFYLGQQALLVFGIVTSESYSESFFATNIMPSIMAAVTIFVWAMIGGAIQKTYRAIRK